MKDDIVCVCVCAREKESDVQVEVAWWRYHVGVVRENTQIDRQSTQTHKK